MNDSPREPKRRPPRDRSERPKPRPRSRREGASPSSRRVRSRAGRSSAAKPRSADRQRRNRTAPRRKSLARGPTRSRRRIARALGIAALTILLVLGIAGGVVYASILRDLPDTDGKARGRDQTSVVYDRHGEELAKLFAEQDRTDRALDTIPATLIQAVIATEDARYYEHKGVDLIGITRALWVDIRTRSTAQGGSTITQQYVKNAFVTPEQTLRRKLSEALLAYRIEKTYSKDQILELYLNTIYFGHGAYGVESAARVYFGKNVTELDLAQSAMLAGVIRSPGRYSPYLDPKAANGRRATVLRQMTDQGMISEDDRAQAASSELQLAGLTSADVTAPYFMEYTKAQLIDEFGAEAVFRGGISVRTTLDARMQRIAETAIAEIFDQEDDPSAALVALDPRTGEILAMVGGRDFTSQQYNVAVQGRRQPGSAFKPFVLAAALDEGVTVEDAFECGPGEFVLPNGQTWKVTGAPGRSGPMRLREAMERSVNSVFAKLILDVGVDRVVDTARAMGISTEMAPVPAIALGGHAEGVSPLEMAAAYGTLAEGGRHAQPYGIISVSDADEEVLRSSEPTLTEALDPAVAYVVTDALRGVISRGTGSAAAIGRPAAGKTGTTQAYRDAWFVGYTPDLVAAVWVGYPEEQREMRNVHGRKVTGGSFPAQIWATFMRQALEDSDAIDFERPSGLVNASVCRESGGLSTEWCTDTFQGLFIAGRLPTDSCFMHTGPENVAMPDLIGITKERAIAILAELDLEANVAEEEIRGVPAGIVARQEPPSDTEVEVGSTVTIVVSSGAMRVIPPRAAFTLSATEALVYQELAFDASGSKASGRIVLYLWEFGDGTEAEGKKTSHAYEDPGTYTVVLWVTDDNDQASSVTKSIVVR